MKDKEKQIEEMAKDLKDLVSIVRNVLVDRTDIGYIPDLAFPIAKEVLKHYQSKLPEDSVVLTEEEAERLSSSHDIIFCDNKDCSNNILCRCAEISECPKNIPEYNEKLSINQHKLYLFQKLCKERERANGWRDRYNLLQKELGNKGKETAEKILYDLQQVLSNKGTTKAELDYFLKSWAKHFDVDIKE